MSATNQHRETERILSQKNLTDRLELLYQVLKEIVAKHETRARRITARYKWIHLHQASRYIELLSERDLEKILKTTTLQTIRVNTILTNRDKLRQRLESKGLALSNYDPTPYGLVVRHTPKPLGALHEYMLGLYTIQGPASMLAVIALDPSKATRILDMCAGAGIKTTQIAQHNTKAPIIAIDISKRKLLALKNNLSRLHVKNVLALHMDSREASKLGKFDYILLDAPCSGEGLIVYPEKSKPRTITDIMTRVKLQIELLNSALNTAKKEARILYATCSMSFEENEYVIDTLLNIRGDFELEDLEIPGNKGVTKYAGLRTDPSLSRCRRLYPHIHGTEGFTICKLRKTKT